MDDVVMFPKMLMQHNLHLYLFRGQTASAERVFFVDELDGDDGFRCIMGDGFADTVAILVEDSSGEDEGTHEAYAPCPMVLLTSRKGKFVGRGAA